MAKELKVL